MAPSDLDEIYQHPGSAQDPNRLVNQSSTGVNNPVDTEMDCFTDVTMLERRINDLSQENAPRQSDGATKSTDLLEFRDMSLT